MTHFRIRPFESGDLPPVLELMRESLGEKAVLQRTPELFSWKHLDNPFGRSLMLVAEDPEGIVGFRAFMRWELGTPAGDLLRCVRPVDTATHPRARRQGVFRRLTEAAVERAREAGVHLIFNTPNPQSGAGYLKMGWQQVGVIGAMVRPLRLRRFLAKSDRPPTVEGGSVWGEREATDREPLGLRTPRSVEYLKWRFGMHPTARYFVSQTADGSVAVLRSNLRANRAELVVSDLFGSNAAAALRSVAGNTDAGYLAGWASSHAPERRTLLRAGLVPIPGVKALSLYARPLAPLEIPATNLDGWDLMLSDLELL
jgi:GNAT superfamily N-acetyltransferase